MWTVSLTNNAETVFIRVCWITVLVFFYLGRFLVFFSSCDNLHCWSCSRHFRISLLWPSKYKYCDVMDTENQVYVFVCDWLIKTGHYFLKFYDKPLAPLNPPKVLTFHFSQKNIRDIKNLTQMHRYLVKLKITPLIAIGKWHNTLGTQHTSNFLQWIQKLVDFFITWVTWACEPIILFEEGIVTLVKRQSVILHVH